jgi:hypothetical protein
MLMKCRRPFQARVSTIHPSTSVKVGQGVVHMMLNAQFFGQLYDEISKK